MDSRYIQFATADNLNKLADELLPLLTLNPEEFHRKYFDIDTCESDGLDNWGEILNLSRTIQITDATSGVFGFGKQSDYPIPPTGYPQNFNNGFFYNPDYEGDTTNPVTLNDFQYRLVLKFRYRALTSNMSLYSINNIMNSLIVALNPTFKCFVYMSGFMQLTYKFNFALQDWQKAIFKNRDILPVPAGITAILIEAQPL